MGFAKRLKTPLVLCALVASVPLSGCTSTNQGFSAAALKEAVTPKFIRSSGYSARDKECMARAMFFESHRSSRDGMIAVGTVVMNRKRSGKHPDTVCGVVGEKGQFAPGVMTREMNSKALPDVMEAAEAVLEGERNPKLKNAMHFHTAGLKFKYKNMHYITVAGGNAFYEKRSRGWQPLPVEDNVSVMVASAEEPAAVETPAVPTTALALAAPDEDKAEIITAAIPLPSKSPAKPKAVMVAADEDEPAAVEAPVATFQPTADNPADINPARFQ